MKIATHLSTDPLVLESLQRLLPIRTPEKFHTSIEQQIAQYNLICNADVFLVLNNGHTLDSDLSLQITYAMIERKPIIILEPPTFDTTVPLFLKELLLSRLSKFMLCDLTMLDDNDVYNFIENMTKGQNYVLTRHEIVLSRAQIRSFFRSSHNLSNVVGEQIS